MMEVQRVIFPYNDKCWGSTQVSILASKSCFPHHAQHVACICQDDSLSEPCQSPLGFFFKPSSDIGTHKPAVGVQVRLANQSQYDMQ